MDLDQVRHTFEGMGEGAAEFMRQMSLGSARTWGIQARQILQLRERYDTQDLDRALAHAAAYGALTRSAVERILDAKAKPRSLDEYVVEDTARRLEQTLGECRTEPRDLTEYDRLPLAIRAPEKPWPLDEPDPPTPNKNSSDSEDTSDSSD
ncbi:MAG: hypothetical protein GXP55_25170 [Deltaproteobacteria bacterium]|nr:hypothetical protein [Deltaproteobacteria bacterium]